jgi:hypothetical protein
MTETVPIENQMNPRSGTGVVQAIKLMIFDVIILLLMVVCWNIRASRRSVRSVAGIGAKQS